jgi:Ca2+-binding RTX toxin-like protein
LIFFLSQPASSYNRDLRPFRLETNEHPRQTFRGMSMSIRPWIQGFRNRIRLSSVKRAHRERQGHPSRQHIEKMEQRTLLSAQVLVLDGTLQIVTDAGEDVTVRIDPGFSLNVQVLIDGVAAGAVQSLAANTVTDIEIVTGDDDNVIDISGVTSADFTVLRSIIIDAGDGNDTITGTTDFADNISGGDGNDTITVTGGLNTLSGGDGNDIITGGADADSIDAGDGDDNVMGNGGDDFIIGDDGNDTIDGGDGADSIAAGNGSDQVMGGLGNDTLSGDVGTDTVSGGDGDDFVYGGGGADTLTGDLGDDTMIGHGGNDSVDGGAGMDSLSGRGGKDTLFGGDDDDEVSGDLGDDLVQGGAGSDLLLGGGGNDTMFDDSSTSSGVGVTVINDDTILGNGGDDTLFSRSGADSLVGGAGNDLIDARTLTVSINDIRIDPEGDAGTTQTATFTVTLTVPSTQTIVVDFATSSDGTLTGGTASAGTDYIAAMNQIVFLPGQVSQPINITILGDDVDESDEETFFVNLTNATNATIFDGLGEGRIIDDDTGGISNLDVFLLFDDTLSFNSATTSVQTAFASIITNLQTNFPNADLAFGVGRFEAYTGGGFFGGGTEQPFILNQPLISTATPQFQLAIDAALNRNAPAIGQGEETIFEALLQIALGAGFDGNGDGDTVDNGPAGLFTTQTNNNPVGDIPAYSTFVNDLLGDPMGPILDPTVPVASVTNGVGFRPGARHIVLLATDSDTVVHEDDGQAVYTGANSSMEPAATFAGGIRATPNGAGAGIQATIDALIAAGIEVITLGEGGGGGPFGGMTAEAELRAISLLTGTLNNTSMPIENNITPGPSADDIQPGEPLYFEIDQNDPVGLADAIVEGITGAVGNVIPPPPPAPPVIMNVGNQNDTMDGSDGRDTIFANDSDDLIVGGGGDDLVDAGGGDDFIYGGSGGDTLTGGAGDDSIFGQGGQDLLDGGDGEDELVWRGLGDGRDTVIGGNGGDLLSVNTSDDTNILTVDQDMMDRLVISEGTASVTVDSTVASVNINAGGGNDSVTVNNVSGVGLMELQINGDAGNDVVDASATALGLLRLEISGGIGDDILTGSQGDDVIHGNENNDMIFGGMGNDTLNGNAGDDAADGQGGDDSIDGGDGNDNLLGGEGNDFLDGGFGNDFADGGRGDDTLMGGFGNDALIGSFGNDSLDGGIGRDFLAGGTGDDFLDGGRNNDTIRGHSGNDTIVGGHGDDSISGDGGDDELVGGDGDDTIFGGNGNDGLAGNDGNDFLQGDQGSDTISGGDGDDNLIGGGGRDTLLGGDGADTLNGNGGRDVGAFGEGADFLPAINIEVLDEEFVLSAKMMQSLDGV